MTQDKGQAPAQPDSTEGDVFRALIEFLLCTDEALVFLRCWNEGNFDACRKEWPEAPSVLYPDTFLFQAAQQAPAGANLFDEQGFRDWVLRNLPDDTIIGNGAWWADHLTARAKRFMKAAPAAPSTPASGGWACEAVRIEKTEMNGWCAYLDIEDVDKVRIGTVSLARGIDSEERTKSLVRGWALRLMPKPPVCPEITGQSHKTWCGYVAKTVCKTLGYPPNPSLHALAAQAVERCLYALPSSPTIEGESK